MYLPIYDHADTRSGNEFYNDIVIQASAGYPDYITITDHIELRNELRGKVGVYADNIITNWLVDRSDNFINNKF